MAASPETYGVRWELAEDESFSRIVRRLAVEATPDLGHSVQVELTGLQRAPAVLLPPPRGYGDQYHPAYQDRADRSAGAAALRLVPDYSQRYFTAYRHMAEPDLDLVLQLGDYIYEGAGVNTVAEGAPCTGRALHDPDRLPPPVQPVQDRPDL